MIPAKHRSFQLSGTRWGHFTRGMWIAFLLALLPLPSWTLWATYIKPKLAAPSYDFEPDEVAAAQEAEALLQTARRAVHDTFARTGRVPFALTGDDGCDVPAQQMSGQHYVLVNGLEVLETGELQLVAVPLMGDYPVCCIRFLPGDTSGEVYAVPHPR